MITLLSKLLYKLIIAVEHQWNTLVEKISRRTANALLTYMAVVMLFEVVWVTLVLSALALIQVVH